MASIANAVRKSLTYKRETTWGTPAGASGAKDLRRVQGAFNLNKESYESAEIRTDYQTAVARHGVRSVEGSLNGELSAGSYSDFISAIVARDFTAGVSASSLTLTIAANGSNWDITRSAGSYLTDGFKVGEVVQLTGASLNAANVSKNLFVLGVTATVLTVKVLNGTVLVAQSAIASCTAAVVGKKTYVPTTGHTDVSYTFEEWFNDITVSEVYTGVKANSAAFSLPTSGFATCDFGFMGKDLAQTGTSRYFTSPTAIGSTAGLAAVNGALMIDGAAVALLTSLNFTINREVTMLNVVGSNTAADANTGRITVSGSFSAYFTDGTYRDKFINEVEAQLAVALTADNTANADVLAFCLPRVKVNSATKTDDTTGVVASFDFVALMNTAGGTGTSTEKTTIVIQDSQA